jgi:prepilin signal peptidase PulO-like enzyme (type II secretory pathway)
MEFLSGLLFVLALIKFGMGWPLAAALIEISIFIVIIIVDMEQGLLPHVIVYPAIAIVLVIAGANSFLGAQPDFLSALMGLSLGAGIFLLLWGAPKLFQRTIIGFGDVGAAGLIGASVGYPLVIIALYLAIFTGGITVIVLLALKMRKLSDPIHFGLYLALGAIGTIFVGEEILTVTSLLLTG